MISVLSSANNIINDLYFTTYNMAVPGVEALAAHQAHICTFYFWHSCIWGEPMWLASASYLWVESDVCHPQAWHLNPSHMSPAPSVFQVTCYKMETAWVPKSPPGEEPSNPHQLDMHLCVLNSWKLGVHLLTNATTWSGCSHSLLLGKKMDKDPAPHLETSVIVLTACENHKNKYWVHTTSITHATLLITLLCGGGCSHPHSTQEESESQRGELICLAIHCYR